MPADPVAMQQLKVRTGIQTLEGMRALGLQGFSPIEVNPLWEHTSSACTLFSGQKAWILASLKSTPEYPESGRSGQTEHPIP